MNFRIAGLGRAIPTRKRASMVLGMAICLTFAGCGGDDALVTPRVGTITVNPEPDSIDAPWQLLGPGDFSRTGNGDMTLEAMSAGDYTLTWGEKSGWALPTPAIATQSLAADGSAVFTGSYTEDQDVPAGFVALSAGSFTMGSPPEEQGTFGLETQHQVSLTRGFYLQTTEVTNQQYAELAQWAYDNGYVTEVYGRLQDNLDGSTITLKQVGSASREVYLSNGVFSCNNPDHPVKWVTWQGAAAYCDWLSLREGLPRAYDHLTWRCNGGAPYTAAGYRLPTEAEWEYACRAGSTTAFANGPITDPGSCEPGGSVLDAVGWYCGNAADWTHPTAQKLPNAWGLYDMHGNVAEWCNDWCLGYGGTATDPSGPVTGSARVFRGGSHANTPQYCRSAWRDYYYDPDYSNSDRGFRCARTAP